MLEYTYQYNSRYQPSAPFVDVELSVSPRDKRPIEASAQIDSGADVSAVPLSILKQLGAGKQREQRMIGMSGRPEPVKIYEVYIKMAGRTIPVDVIGLDHLQEVVIGRDILNYFTVTLDGLALTTIIPAEPDRS